MPGSLQDISQTDALSWQELKTAAEAGFEELLRHQEAAATAGQQQCGQVSWRRPGMSRPKGGTPYSATALGDPALQACKFAREPCSSNSMPAVGDNGLMHQNKQSHHQRSKSMPWAAARASSRCHKTAWPASFLQVPVSFPHHQHVQALVHTPAAIMPLEAPACLQHQNGQTGCNRYWTGH